MAIRYETLEDIMQTGAYVCAYCNDERTGADVMIVNYGGALYNVYYYLECRGWFEIDCFTDTTATTNDERKEKALDYLWYADFQELLEIIFN